MARTRINLDLDRTLFLIVIPGHDHLGAMSETEAEHIYRSCFGGDDDRRSDEMGTQARLESGVRVVAMNPVEGWSRDVTLDFADWGNADDEDAQFASYRSARRVERAAAAKVL